MWVSHNICVRQNLDHLRLRPRKALIINQFIRQLCAVRRPCAARRAPARGRPGAVRPLAFLGGAFDKRNVVSFRLSILKAVLASNPFVHLILFGACALHKESQTRR